MKQDIWSKRNQWHRCGRGSCLASSPGVTDTAYVNRMVGARHCRQAARSSTEKSWACLAHTEEG